MTLALNQVSLEDFAHFPITPIEGTRASSPFSYKLKTINHEPIDAEFWFYERRTRNGAWNVFYWSITKLRVLYIVEAHGKRAIDATRFVNGQWVRQIYPFSYVNGFGSEDENAHRLFRDEKSIMSYGFKSKLLGMEVRDISDNIYDPPTLKIQHKMPVYEKLGDNISIDNYIGHLGTKFGWSAGAIVGVERGLLVQKLVVNTPFNYMVVDPYTREIDQFGGSMSPFNKSELEQHVKLLLEVQRLYPERLKFCRAKTHEVIEGIPDESLDFVYFRHTAKTTSVTIAYEIDAWLPKIKSSGWLMGNGIDRSTIHSVVDIKMPNWHLGHVNTWLRAKNES